MHSPSLDDRAGMASRHNPWRRERHSALQPPRSGLEYFTEIKASGPFRVVEQQITLSVCYAYTDMICVLRCKTCKWKNVARSFFFENNVPRSQLSMLILLRVFYSRSVLYAVADMATFRRDTNLDHLQLTANCTIKLR